MNAALDVEPVLNMLVFGESILNDAVAIVLTTTIIGGQWGILLEKITNISSF